MKSLCNPDLGGESVRGYERGEVVVSLHDWMARQLNGLCDLATRLREEISNHGGQLSVGVGVGNALFGRAAEYLRDGWRSRLWWLWL